MALVRNHDDLSQIHLMHAKSDTHQGDIVLQHLVEQVEVGVAHQQHTPVLKTKEGRSSLEAQNIVNIQERECNG